MSGRETGPHADAPQEPESAEPTGLDGAWQVAERGIDAEPDPATAQAEHPRGSRERTRIFAAAGSIIAVAAIVLTFVLIKLDAKTTSSVSPSNGHTGAVPTAVVDKVTSVPASTLADA